MKIVRSLSPLFVVFAAAAALAHGEDVPGPHGGAIRMPGSFHTEALSEGPKRLRVYLLDVGFGNPTVADSAITASFAGPAKSDARCRKEKDSFLCTFDGNVNLEKPGKLTVVATRAKKKGSAAVYETPLKK